MKTFLNLLIGLFLISESVAQEADSKAVPFVSYWSTGDSYDFLITKIKEQWKMGELEKRDSTSYIATFEVIDSTETSYKIKWKYKNRVVSGLEIPIELSSKLNKFDMTEVIYETTETGAFVGIENWEEIGAMLKEIYQHLSESIMESGEVDKVQLDQIMGPLMSVYNSKQGIEQLIFKELQFFHFPLGREYSVEEPIVYEEQLPNMLGGAPIRGDAKLYVDSLDTDSGYCALVREMKLNPEDTRNIVAALFKRMQVEDDELDEAMASAQFDIQDYNRFEYFYYPGVPILIETNRTSLIDIAQEKGKRIETLRIELLNSED